MKSFEINAIGLEEISFNDQKITSGGDLLPKIGVGAALVAAWEWVNDHWDAIVEGFERGTAEGVENFF